jgi:hypothetical protein
MAGGVTQTLAIAALEARAVAHRDFVVSRLTNNGRFSTEFRRLCSAPDRLTHYGDARIAESGDWVVTTNRRSDRGHGIVWLIERVSGVQLDRAVAFLERMLQDAERTA